MSENAIAKIDYGNREVILTLKSTVAIGATDAEFAMFLEQCKATGLNPFKREVWFIKAGGRAQIMTGIQGFFAIANADPMFDGYESGLITPNGEMVSGAYPKNDFIGSWCRVHRKDRKIPSEGVAMLQEYDKGHGNWKSMRRVMIIKCAESVALRKAFPQHLNGLYTQEEMPSEFSSQTQKIMSSDRDIDSSVVPADNLPAPEQVEAQEPGERVEYALNPKDTRYNFAEWKNRLKKHRFMWEPERKVWIGFTRFPELDALLQPAQSEEFEEDELPLSWNDIPAE